MQVLETQERNTVYARGKVFLFANTIQWKPKCPWTLANCGHSILARGSTNKTAITIDWLFFEQQADTVYCNSSLRNLHVTLWIFKNIALDRELLGIQNALGIVLPCSQGSRYQPRGKGVACAEA